MPSAYQIYKKRSFEQVKTNYFSDYKLKDGEVLVSLVSVKCKELWSILDEAEKQPFIDLSENKTESLPTYEESEKEKTEVKNKRKNKTTSSEENSSNELSEESVSKPVNKRKKIPKAVRESVWKKYVSETNLEGKCFVGCGTHIQINNFELGHVVAFSNGGCDTIDNLRPICSLCNKSMGTTNLIEFIEQFNFKNDNSYDNEIESAKIDITSIEKNISKMVKSSKTLNNKQDKLGKEIESFEEQINALTITLETKKKEFEKNSEKLIGIEKTLNEKVNEKNVLEQKNCELNMKKEIILKNKLLEEERIKEEIRNEILLEQRKEKLKLEVMKEMGLTV
jgi:5-methylcytosine-specific restriction endonuclease McrA